MGSIHDHGQTAGPHRAGDGMVNSSPLEPRSKLLSGVIFVFGVISINNAWLLAVTLVFAVVFALWGGFSLRQLINRLSVLVPFLALMSIPLVFGAGFPPAPERVDLALLILLKALTAMTFTLYVFTNQPVEEMLEALEHLKVPPAITTVIYMAYRYGFLFIQEMQTTVRALKARLFNAGLSRQSLPVYGELAGGLFIKSLNRSETVYRALASRGFEGKIPVGSPRPVTTRDLFAAVLPVSFLAVLLIVEQVVF